MPSIANRAVRIGGSSGAVTDRHEAMERIARYEDVDVIHGDWMSEYNMTKRGAEKYAATKSTKVVNSAAFEPTFIESIKPALKYVAAKKIKVACNAGASDPGALADYVRGMIKDQGLNLSVAWVSGDEVSLDLLKHQQASGNSLQSLTTDKALSEWDFEPIYAQCYLGAFGIAEACSRGADIVLAGRVADAAPVMAAGIWWHGWSREDFDALAGAFVCGHLIECSNYVSGANWSGFKKFGSKVTNFGFPVAEIAEDGSFVVTKEQNTDGCVTIETCKSQLLYEIQGPWYYNSDVTAELANIIFEQVGEDRVKVTGVKELTAIQFAKNLGFRVLGVDARDEGIALSRKVGADAVLDARVGRAELVKAVKAVTGGELMFATVVLSDHETAADTSCAITRSHGRVVQVAQPARVCVDFKELIFRDIRLEGSLLASQEELVEMIHFVLEKKIIVETHAFEGLKSLPTVVETAHSNRSAGKLVVVVDTEAVAEDRKRNRW